MPAELPSPPPPPDNPSPVHTPLDMVAVAAKALGLEREELQALLDAKKVETAKVDVGQPNPDAPPMPPEDPRAGDKTPAIVEWYRDNWPKEYERRYAGRRTHLADRRIPHEQRDPKLTRGVPVDDPEVFKTYTETSPDPRVRELSPIKLGGMIPADDPNLSPL